MICNWPYDLICYSVEDLRTFSYFWQSTSKTVFLLTDIYTYIYCVPELLFNHSLSKHLPSSDSMSLKVDVEALENSPGATYIRKKGGKVTGDNQPKEQG